MTTLYGICNCDSVAKAKKWLKQADIDFAFVDFRKDGLKLEQVSAWAAAVGIEKLLNKRGTTWRKLNDEQKALEATEDLVALMTENPTLIKRPVLDAQGRIEVGFNTDLYTDILQ